MWQAVIPSIEHFLTSDSSTPPVSSSPSPSSPSPFSPSQSPSAGRLDSSGASAPLYFLDAELKPLSLSTACGVSEGSGLGLTKQWAETLSRCSNEKRQVCSGWS